MKIFGSPPRLDTSLIPSIPVSYTHLDVYKRQGWDLEWNAVGTGEALKMGENGDVDVVLVHETVSYTHLMRRLRG